MDKDEKFFEENQVDGKLSDEKMADLLTGAIDGETSEDEESEKVPELASDEDKEPEGKEDESKTPEEEQDDEKPVILGKHGTHTIEYAKLEEARAGEKHWKEQYETLQASIEGSDKSSHEKQEMLDRVDAAKELDAKLGTTDAVDELLKDLDEDEWPEIVRPLKGLVEANKHLSAVNDDLQKRLDRLEQKAEQGEQNELQSKFDAHFDAIEAAHKDYESIPESREFEAWKDSKPSYEQKGIALTVKNGTANEVIQLYNNFKEETGVATAGDTAGKKSSGPDPREAKRIAEEKVNNATKSTPRSLSDVPAGSAPHHDEVEALINMSPEKQIDAFLMKDPAKILETLDKVM